MKLALLCLLLGTNLMWVGLTYAQRTSLALDLNDVELEEVFDAIRRQSEFEFFYNNDQVNTSVKVSVRLHAANIDEVLNQVLPAAYEYKINDRYILISKRKEQHPATTLSPQLQQGKRTITGVVTDERGDPIIGANVVEKGTTNGVITDTDGAFSLLIPENAVLQISYIGYSNQEVRLGSQTSLRIALKEDIQIIDEIVVTALGIKREEKALGYAVQKLAGDKITTVKGTDVGTALTGKISGLNVKNSTEFNSAPSLSLRGETPLVVVDEVPYQKIYLRDIASDDIESIDV